MSPLHLLHLLDWSPAQAEAAAVAALAEECSETRAPRILIGGAGVAAMAETEYRLGPVRPMVVERPARRLGPGGASMRGRADCAKIALADFGASWGRRGGALTKAGRPPTRSRRLTPSVAPSGIGRSNLDRRRA